MIIETIKSTIHFLNKVEIEIMMLNMHKAKSDHYKY